MLITNTFDNDTSNDWQVYNTGSASVVSGKLRYSNPNTTQGALLAPYILSSPTTINFEINLVSDNAGRQHAGCWLYDKAKNNWFRFYFLDNNIGTALIVNANPNNSTNWVGQIDTPISPTLNSGGVFKFKLEVNGTSVSTYYNDTLVNTRDVGFIPTGFALFAYGCTIDIDNLTLNAFVIDDLTIPPTGTTDYFNLYTQNEQGSITGTVKETGLPENAEVGLYDRKTRQLIALTRSVGGIYSFVGIDKNREYYVHAIDDHRLYNAVTQDMLPGNYDDMKAKGLV